MAMWSLTAEKKEELLRKKDDKHKELDKVYKLNLRKVGGAVAQLVERPSKGPV